MFHNKLTLDDTTVAVVIAEKMEIHDQEVETPLSTLDAD